MSPIFSFSSLPPRQTPTLRQSTKPLQSETSNLDIHHELESKHPEMRTYLEKAIGTGGNDLHSSSDKGEIQNGSVVGIDGLDAGKVGQRPQFQSAVGTGSG